MSFFAQFPDNTEKDHLQVEDSVEMSQVTKNMSPPQVEMTVKSMV